MISQVARFVVLLVVTMGAATAAGIVSKAHVADVVIELRSDAVVWGNFTIISTPQVGGGPLHRGPAVYNFTTPSGVVYVAYLPAGSVVNVTDAWVVGVYRYK